MIKIKHLFDAVEPDDGNRLLVSAWGLTRDLAEWCKVDAWLGDASPPRELAEWFDRHPDGWEHFRGVYHEALSRPPLRQHLRDLSRHAIDQNITLLHTEEQPAYNAAVALYEFLADLQAYCSSDD